MVELAATIWRDFVTDGVPSSGAWKPQKSQIREWGKYLENLQTGSGLLYAFSTNTADGDPGPGLFRMNNASPASATALYFDNLDAEGIAVNDVIDTWDDSTNVVRGQLTIRGVDSASRFVYSVVGSIVDGGGYRKVNVANVSSSGVVTATEEFVVVFNRAGDTDLDNQAFNQTGTGSFSTDQTPQPRIHRMADRLFLDGAVSFNGQFLDANITGLSADAKALHSWGPRDASLFVDSSVAGIAIVGHSESKKHAGWAGTGLGAVPASTGVAGFAINNRVGGNGQAWGGYFDAVRLTNGFTVGVEVAMANFGSESTITPFNVKSGGADGGVAVWAQIGCGLDLVAYPGAIKDIAAGFALLSSYADNSAKARTGFVIANGALKDRSGGSFTYEAFAMPDRHQIAWYRSSDQTQSAFIWADAIVGSPVGITMKTGGVEFTGGGTLVNNVFVGLASAGNAPYVAAGGSDTNVGLGHYTKGTGVHSFLTNGAAKQFEVAHIANSVNWLQARGGAATASPRLSAQGGDVNVGLELATKGTGAYSFYTNGTAKQFEILHVASAVNYLSASGAPAAGGVSLAAQGGDTDVSFTLQSKGAGSIFLNSRSLIALQIDSAASAVNRLALINAATAGQPMMYVTGTDANISGIFQGKGTGGWQFKDGATNKKFEYNSTGVGFFAVAPVAKQTVGAALNTGGAETNTNLATRINDIRTALINYGLAA